MNMKRWSIFMSLVAAMVVLLIAKELVLKNIENYERNPHPRAELVTWTPTITATAGWWGQFATWTPSPTPGSAGAP